MRRASREQSAPLSRDSFLLSTFRRLSKCYGHLSLPSEIRRRRHHQATRPLEPRDWLLSCNQHPFSNPKRSISPLPYPTPERDTAVSFAPVSIPFSTRNHHVSARVLDLCALRSSSH
ncbi:hypothetical protein OH77DRAFT_1324684 [Trametes cingulata]|nr:hypothetical protein OH77DRAFT_1324684 [Trametes cingulata]